MRVAVLVMILAMLALVGTASADGAPRLIAIGERGTAVVFAADHPADARPLVLTGLGDRLIGIDERPADGVLYGLTTGNDLYRIDPETGACTLVSSLTVPFNGGARSGIDFTPEADRLRLMSAEGQNMRVNVVLGATAADTPLTYAADDRNAGHRPRVTAAAYINNRRGATTTRLFEIDGELDVLVVQDPPNPGVLVTIGPLGVDFGTLGGFDIVTRADGSDTAYAASGTTLYTVDLKSGAATAVGTLGGLTEPVIGLAASGAVPSP